MATQEFGIRIVALGVGEFRRNVQGATSDLNGLNGTISRVTGVSSSLGNTLTTVGNSIAGIGRSITIGLTAPLLALLGALINAGMTFEEAFAGIGKTVDGVAIGFDEIRAAAQDQLGIAVTNMDEAKRAAEELGIAFGDLTPVGLTVRDAFRDLGAELPIPISALAELGEQIGQLGVNSDDIVEVTRLISYLGVATELSAEDAANGLIRFKNIMMGATGDIVDFVNSAGSALVALGNSSVSTEGEILNLTLRLAAAGDRAKMTAPEILAWATTLSDLGVRAEAGGTAVSRAITEMVFSIQTGSENVATFAQVSGQSVEEFSKAFEEDASAALSHFIEKLEEGIRSGTVTKEMLEDMGLSGVRAIDVMGRLGDAMDIFDKNLDTSNKAWEEQIALQNEAEKRFATVRSQIQLAKNAFTDLGITIFDMVKGDLESLISSLRDIVDWFKHLPPGMQETIVKVSLLVAAIGPLLVIGGMLISALGPVVALIAGIATPAGLAALALGGLAAIIIDNYGDEIIGVLQPIIDTFKDMWAIMTQVPEVHIPVISGEGGVFAPDSTLAPERAQAMGAQAPIVEEEQVSLTERFQEAAARLKETLVELIPPELLPAIQTLKEGFTAIAGVVAMAGSAIGNTITNILGGSLKDTIDTLTETLSSMGIEWSDVWNVIAMTVVAAVGTIAAILVGIVVIVLAVVNGVISAIEPMTAAFDSFVEGFQTFVQGIIDVFVGLFDIFYGFGEVVGGVFEIIAGFITGNQEVIDKGTQHIRDGISDLVTGIGQLLSGLIEMFAGFGTMFLSILVGFIGAAINFFLGFGETITGFFGDLYGQITGDTNNAWTQVAASFGIFKEKAVEIVDNLTNSISTTFTEWAGTIKFLFSDLVDTIVAFFIGLYDDLIGHSIVTDMTADILQAISDFKEVFLGFVGDLVSGAVDKFVELGSAIGEALGGIFGGGGEGFELDMSALDEAKVKVEEFKSSLTDLPAIASTAATAFVTEFSSVVIEQTTLMTQTFLLLWQTAILNFGLLLPLVNEAFVIMTAGILLVITDFTILMTELWIEMSNNLVTETGLLAAYVIDQHNAMKEGILQAISEIVGGYTNMVQTSLALFGQMVSGMILVMSGNEALAKQTSEVIPIATSYVDGLAGAYRALAQAASDAAAAVVEANQQIAESGGQAYGDLTGSPTLKLQHPFERFEDYLKSADFNFMETSVFGSLYSLLSGVLVPQAIGATTTTTNNTLNVGQINGGIGDETGANMLYERWLALKERR
jgi:TP901 family phage tail tape measure protein